MLMRATVQWGVRTLKQSLHWQLTPGRTPLAAPGNRTCVSGVTVRSSNQLSYIPSSLLVCKWGIEERSNRLGPVSSKKKKKITINHFVGLNCLFIVHTSCCPIRLAAVDGIGYALKTNLFKSDCLWPFSVCCHSSTDYRQSLAASLRVRGCMFVCVRACGHVCALVCAYVLIVMQWYRFFACAERGLRMYCKVRVSFERTQLFHVSLLLS